MRRKKLVPFGIALLVVGILLGMRIGSAVSGDNTYQQLQKLQNAFLIIQKYYVEGVDPAALVDRKSTRLNSSHVRISYAVFCLKKKKNKNKIGSPTHSTP